MKHKTSQKKKIIKARAKVMKLTIRKKKINKTKSQFSEETRKIYKTLSRFTKEKERRHKLPITGIKEGGVTTDPTNIKRILREHYE